MNLNLNKLFPYLSIRKKLIIAFTLLSFIPLTVIGLIGLYNNIQTLEKVALEDLNHDVALLRERAKNFLLNVDLDMRFLCASPVFSQFLESLYQDSNRNHNLVVQQFRTFAQTKKIYYQLHFIDHRGNEIFNIRYDEGVYQIIPQHQLSTSHFLYYALLTDSLQKDEMAFTPVELIDAHQNKIPAISYAIRIYDSAGEYSGIFVADIFAKDFFQVLESNVHLDTHRKFAIVNSEGFYLYHSEKKKNWNRLLAARETQNLGEDYPPDFARAILSGKFGIISKAKNHIAAYTPLFMAPFPASNSYFLFESVEKNDVLGPAHRFAFIFVTLLLVFLIISISAGLIATRQLAVPIRELQRGAKIISQGNYAYRLKIETNDEIEELAHQFNQMAQAVYERETLLAEQQKQLEETVIQRTTELRSEKEKMQAILDNVPSAFLLLDENCHILSASAAIQKITGHSQQKVIGQKCYEIFPNKDICKHCAINNKSGKREITYFVETQTKKNEDTVFIEHISVPLILNDQNPAHLEILTDITERKKFEEHFLQTERLAATGEMAAVIAHEMRNSLTSLKMILQLQRELSKTEENAQSLQVATQSIHRMETVVNNLLRFARPANYEFQSKDINQLIEECLLFIQPQFDKKNITITKTFQEEIPEILLDVNHMKEAIINILLNSAQAIDGHGKILIKSELTRLGRTIEDYGFSDQKTFSFHGSSQKVILSKGQRVVRIEFQDNGPGIPSKQLSKIFDPFFTTKLNGTGLGLTTVKRTINQHGGIIRVHSKLKRGTTFQIFLPIRRPA